MPEVVARIVDEAARARLVAGGVDPRLARLFAARGVRDAAELATALPGLVPPDRLGHVDEAAALLADAIAAGSRILIVADYDADGATACAVGLRALRAMGASVDFLVPDRFRFGYGLTPEIVAPGGRALAGSPRHRRQRHRLRRGRGGGQSPAACASW